MAYHEEWRELSQFMEFEHDITADDAPTSIYLKGEVDPFATYFITNETMGDPDGGSCLYRLEIHADDDVAERNRLIAALRVIREQMQPYQCGHTFDCCGCVFAASIDYVGKWPACSGNHHLFVSTFHRNV